MEIARSVKPVQDGRIHIEKINWPMLTTFAAEPAEYKAGLDYAIAQDCALAVRKRHLCEDHR